MLLNERPLSVREPKTQVNPYFALINGKSNITNLFGTNLASRNIRTASVQGVRMHKSIKVTNLKTNSWRTIAWGAAPYKRSVYSSHFMHYVHPRTVKLEIKILSKQPQKRRSSLTIFDAPQRALSAIKNLKYQATPTPIRRRISEYGEYINTDNYFHLRTLLLASPSTISINRSNKIRESIIHIKK